MSASPASATVIRFGVFELDMRSGELRKAGMKIRLQQQPLQLLQILLQHPGEVVPREEIRRQLWGEGVYVDFDRALNRAVVKLREALGDLAESPRFIETLPRVGYRFIAAVEGIVESSSLASAELAPIRKKSALPVRQAAGVALALLVLAVLAWWMYRSAGSPSPHVTNVVELSKSRESKLATVVSDGSRLYFVANFGGAMRAAQMSVEGGDVVPLPTSPDNAFIFDISPDGSSLLVGTVVPYDWPPALWILPILGAAPHKVGDVRAAGATWMPDGRRILYAVDKTLYVVEPDGSGSQKLLTVPGRISSPVWSPDGRRLRFDVHIGGDGVSLWEADADGSNAHPFLPEWNQPPYECCGRWTLDGRYYVFQSTRAGRTDLWALRERSGDHAKPEPVRLTNGPLNMLSPFPSRDGKKIFAMGQQKVGELVRYDAPSQQFVPFLDGISAEGVTFSRDGAWVAYVVYPAGTLWRSRADGSEKLQLTTPPMLAGVPVWSPDGKQIAFIASTGENPAWQIYLISAGGGSPQQLTSGTTDLFSPSWSADGSRLVYSPHSWTDTSLLIMDLGNRRVTSVPNSQGFCCATWSLESRYMFAAATSPPRLVMYDMNEQKWSELWRGVFDYYDISRDGSYIYFDTVWQTDPAVYRLRIRDRELERVVSLKNFRRTRGPNGYWFDVAPDNSPLLLRNLSTEQLYEVDLLWP